MSNLIEFLLRYNAFFLFIVLEVFAVYLMVNYNDHHNKVALHSSNVVSGAIMKRYDGMTDYWKLRAVNDSLANQYNQFLNQDTSSYYQHRTKVFATNDSIFERNYNYLSAKVINNSTDRPNNFITLEKGARHGIQKNSGVLSGGGLAGIVLKTSENYSLVMSLLHRNMRLSAKIKRNNHFGSLIWTGNNPRIMTLDAIPKHARILKGDTIVTSGFSSTFPSDIMIGTVSDFRIEQGSNFYTVDVELNTDLSNIEYVNIVQNLMRDEILELQESAGNE